MLCSLDNRPVAFFPDSIYLLDPHSGRGYMSVELRPSDEIVLLAAAAHPRRRAAAQTQAGRQAMSPARFGAPELTDRPLEELPDTS